MKHSIKSFALTASLVLTILIGANKAEAQYGWGGGFNFDHIVIDLSNIDLSYLNNYNQNQPAQSQVQVQQQVQQPQAQPQPQPTLILPDGAGNTLGTHYTKFQNVSQRNPYYQRSEVSAGPAPVGTTQEQDQIFSGAVLQPAAQLPSNSSGSCHVTVSYILDSNVHITSETEISDSIECVNLNTSEGTPQAIPGNYYSLLSDNTILNTLMSARTNPAASLVSKGTVYPSSATTAQIVLNLIRSLDQYAASLQNYQTRKSIYFGGYYVFAQWY